MTSTYYAIFVITAVASLLFLVAGIVMFFLFNIPKIVGMLTGYTAKKQIKLLQSKSVAVSVNQTPSDDNLNAFMQQQRNIAAQVKKDETETVDLKTSDTTSHDRNQNSQIPSQQRPNLAKQAVNQVPRNETKPAVNQVSKNATKPVSDNTENIQKEFKFDIILSLDFINTDEVI